jgi:hypothetical protein
LFVISPFLLVLLPGLPTAWKLAPAAIKGAAMGGGAYLLVQFYLQDSTGGDRFFGYRYPLEALVAAAPLMMISYQHWVRPSRFRTRLLVAGIAIAVVLQAIGVANPHAF